MSTKRDPAPPPGRWWRQWQWYALTLMVLAIYFSRLTELPLAGEETRWGRSAAEMIVTDDWVVIRQQGQVFADRPPLGTWAMALVGLARGNVDSVAIRLPSVLALLFTAWVIYAYARHALSPLGACSAGVAYVTMVQVLQLGRTGESEALFALFLGSALLLWHLGYLRSWPKAAVWVLGYSLAGLAALVKGPQAPVYFVAVTGMYLLLRRERTWWLSWSHGLGILSFVLVVGAWQIPYYFSTDWPCVQDTWWGLKGQRFTLSGLARHLCTYPFETLACLLPWSPLLMFLFFRRFRDSLGGARDTLVFLVTAVLVTFPSLWVAAGARGRYFMPLFPCLAVALGLIVERCARSEAGSLVRRVWSTYLVAVGAAVLLASLFVLGISIPPMRWYAHAAGPVADLVQPLPLAIVFAATALATAATLWCARKRHGDAPAQVAVLALAAWLGLGSTGVMVNYYRQNWHTPSAAVLALKQQLPDPTQLVSFGPAFHPFTYVYQDAIRLLPWPKDVSQVPQNVEYFCFHQSYVNSLMRSDQQPSLVASNNAAPLPFSWTHVATIQCERHKKSHDNIVVGRITRPSPTAAAGQQRTR
jgi:4-amino-4-deoxy-L-arabinose transferase-like glycosyltransferase